ncbi:protein phosphatase 1 regulatory subunit 3A-like [Pseudorasbora parva]|uniref:protein phosphatase 1 regulatory subunit 3A-like n=1 Tax=Pseudorasbora parva TaxID=51549 RepID=UPI00351EFE3A
MESVGTLESPIGASSNLLSLPVTCPWDEDEESLGLEGIKPKSSPIPRRRSSVSSDDSLPPPSSSRRVSFADAFGLSLVSVKQFDARGVTGPSGPLESDLNEDKGYYMVPLFTLPQTVEELSLRVHKQKLELESLELLSGTSTLRGIVRVLNVCFDKMVYVRTSLDSWRSHFDLLAEYVPGSNNGGMDCFSFKLTLVPPFGEEGARVDFCLRYDTSLGTFWANNNEENYSLFCCEKIKEKPPNVCENRRKSCLKLTSPNVSASTVLATKNEEFSDVNLNSGKATDPGSLKENSEKREKDGMELAEEISRIRSRRGKRRAVRLAKVKEHFAKREEERKQGTKTKESEVTSLQKHASVLEKTPCSPQNTRPTTCNQISPSPDESLKSAEYTKYSTDIYSQALTQHEVMINTKTNVSPAHTNLPLEDCGESITCSATEALEDIQLTEDSINLPFPVCQNPDLYICKNVERAWEHFEKDTKRRIKNLALTSKMDEDTNISDGKPEENVSLKTTNSEPPPISHGFTFGTIVAPLYHQVFKNMETERKDFFLKTLQVDSLRELEDESLTAVTAAETTDIWPESCISTKQTVHDVSVGACKESTEQTSQFTVNPTKKPLSEPNKHVEMLEASLFQNDYTGVIREYSSGKTFTETNTSERPDPPLGEVLSVSKFVLTELSFQGDPGHCPCFPPLQEPELLVPTNQTIECGIDSQKIHPSSPTSVLKPSLSLDNQMSGIKIEMSQNQGNLTNIHTKEETILVQKRYSNSTSCILAQSPEDPTMLQRSSDDKSETECECEMRLNIEKPDEFSHLATASLTEPYPVLENTQNMSNTLDNCQMDEKKERMLISFAAQTSETESSSIIEFDREHYALVIKEVEEIHKIKNDESLEEGNGSQKEQVEERKQDVEEKDRELKEQEGAEEKHEDKGGMNSIEDGFKYIDDEEDLDAIETEREKKQQEDADDLLNIERESEDVKSLPQHNIDLNEIENLGGVVDSEKPDRHVNTGEEICEETARSRQGSSQKSDVELSGSMQAMGKDWEFIEFIDKEENTCCGSENSDQDTADDLKNMLEKAKDSLTRDLENVEENTSTESQTDDEMELYLNSLRNTQQSVFREGTVSGSYGKRPSMSKGRPLALPSISESVDEDQPNSSLEDLTNIEYIMELERATLPLVDSNEHVIGRNVLWWKEFLSYDNMSRVIGYTFLLMVFLVVAYYYDFIACFALYLLTVYWLFRQREEPLKNPGKGERGMQ